MLDSTRKELEQRLADVRGGRHIIETPGWPGDGTYQLILPEPPSVETMYKAREYVANEGYTVEVEQYSVLRFRPKLRYTARYSLMVDRAGVSMLQASIIENAFRMFNADITVGAETFGSTIIGIWIFREMRNNALIWIVNSIQGVLTDTIMVDDDLSSVI